MPWGFTLVELLVVIAILSLLLALLLGVIGKARRAAECVACLSNLHHIGQAMLIYVNEESGWLPGSGNTTGRHLWHVNAAGNCGLVNGYTINHIPEVNECCDYIGPLARMMGIDIPSTNGKARFRLYTTLDPFVCPSYRGTLASPDPTASITEGDRQALSYNTALAFLDIAYRGKGQETGFPGNVTLPGPPYWTAPPDYVPRIGRIGNPASKIFCADGARRTQSFGEAAFRPQYVLSSSPMNTGQNETMFADYGPFDGNSRSYDRSAIAGNTTEPPAADPRLAAYRHGTRRPFAPAGEYRMNAVFFDGHAATLDDIESANPALWLPRGTRIVNTTAPSGSPNGSRIIWADVAARYLPHVSKENPYIVR